MSTGRWPDSHSGLTTRDLSNDGVNPKSAPDLIVAILLGPLAEARGGWPIEWPLDKNAANEDARQLHLLADFLDLKASAGIRLSVRPSPSPKAGRSSAWIVSHTWDDPMAHIVAADPHQVRETDRGLEVQGRLDVHDNAVAK
jgi:hypothetical protein